MVDGPQTIKGKVVSVLNYKQDTMKRYGGMDVKVHVFLNSAISKVMVSFTPLLLYPR
jgi:hypothetical protein